MRKYFLLLPAIILLLTECHNKKSQNLVGVWKLAEMNVNGTLISGQSMGGWMWEFNKEGGYLVDVAGQKEKGWYKLQDSTLTVQITTASNKPQTIYAVAQLDSDRLILASPSNGINAMSFVKMKNAGLIDND